MSAVYAESSAVLRWLLGGARGARVGASLEQASTVVSSALTVAEVGRTLQRLAAGTDITPETRDQLWGTFSAAVSHWDLMALSDEILRRAGEPFPREPLRTLDALHLASAALYARQVEPLVVVTVDARLRDNAVALGLAVAPD